MTLAPRLLASLSLLALCAAPTLFAQEPYSLNEESYFEKPGVNVLAFSNPPGGTFFDAKTSGIEIIHHGERTATNGDLRLLPTPEQWDGMGVLVDRQIDHQTQTITTLLEYPEHELRYRVVVKTEAGKILASIHLDEALPEHLVGKAGFNMEFLPAAYFGKSYIMDGEPGLFPRHPSAQMITSENGLTEPSPIAEGNELVLAPADSKQRVRIRVVEGDQPLRLYDGRSKAQNGWYVTRSLLPGGKSGKVAEWELDISGLENWIREPVIGFSQVGYHPNQPKRAIIELDSNDEPASEVSLLRVNSDGSEELVARRAPTSWGRYLRYRYLEFDFSSAQDEGLYRIEYGDTKTNAFPISKKAQEGNWHLTLDVFFPVQMDHMKVREAYRVWHGADHLDDALQAPPNYEHFDLFAHGEDTDTDFAPFEHIPGLNYGGWHDAGDYDIRTQSQYSTVQLLVHVWEQFRPERDNTTVSQARKYAEIQRPDGAADILQQIEHGTLALIAQHRAVGHAIPGIVSGHLYQYPHLGDGITKTDGLIYDPSLDPIASSRTVGQQYLPSTVDPTPNEPAPIEENGYSSRFDDRWAFTTNTSALNYGSAAALAAASRALDSHNASLAQECLQTAKSVWDYESGREPNLFRVGNTTGGRLEEEKLKAAVELLICTGDAQYSDAIRELVPQVEERFFLNAFILAQAIPFMDGDYRDRIRELAIEYKENAQEMVSENPYGVPITRGGWAGSGAVIRYGITNYALHKSFPDLIETNPVFRSIDYLHGVHPDSNYSFVSGVGANSQTVAYGANRADFSFIPGGVVPGVLILPPDYPENKSDWPFFWGQNEYVIPMGSLYLYLANAVEDLLKD
ncbi:glycoside hydrolase family 9 protein [Pelagicoccus sp. SDUM812003]|uniref:glycoside hydrolase family 9 protein n=1 Tax=Pelagicoccus sp. SDUM812003 TaxID=3041267 RepID=UPI00280CAFE2|nr:glycoside hydrolase family 9 protein [Pelagicoccus sp. SDUM812003]MDQ8204226.1 glycoside hydrolase family 9 protein [Pelagicoccus sp. SDUM812003]